MDEIKKITTDELKDLSSQTGFNLTFIAKDYYVTIVLFLLKNIEGLWFKGGTALQKTILDYSRLSEDVDFTVTQEINELKEKIVEQLKNSGLFYKVSMGKQVKDFLRLIAHYKDPFEQEGTVFVDLNRRAKLFLPPARQNVKNFYGIAFDAATLNQTEMIAEKIHALIHRNQPRDYFDAYQIIKRGLAIDMTLVQKKSIIQDRKKLIEMIFRKANKIHSHWNEDLTPLVKKPVSFQTVMSVLKNYFNYAEVKEEKKKEKVK